MKKVLFLTGTRADFGKLKPLIAVLQDQRDFEPHIAVTGMHLDHRYGYTLIEVERSGFPNIHRFQNHTDETTMDLTLSQTIVGFSKLVRGINPDMIVVHGDRVEAMAGAIVGSLNNILVAHIEGGELSGTIDELIRHSVSKLSHIHFVANAEAERRLLQLGELPESVFVIGSPDMDVMFSGLPSLETVTAYYDIPFDRYALALFHPITTESNRMQEHAQQFVAALLRSNKQYVVIYPNNDWGSSHILKAYEELQAHPNFRLFPSLRFEYFLRLLQRADFIIGNSSAGIREAPCYGVPTINIGTRQANRTTNAQIVNCSYATEAILQVLNRPLPQLKQPQMDFGQGDSAQRFLECLRSEHLWQLNHQKQFQDYA